MKKKTKNRNRSAIKAGFAKMMTMIILSGAVITGCNKTTLPAPEVEAATARTEGDAVVVCFDWDAVEGADGYEVSVEEKYSGEEEYREPTTVETSDTEYMASAQDDFDFRIKVRAYTGEDENKSYGEWSSYAEGKTY